MRAWCPELNPTSMFWSLADYENLAERAGAVRSVEITTDHEGHRVSSWEINFRRGILVWSQFDEIDDDQLTIRFTRRDGDPEDFHGSWSVRPAEEGCLVEFEAAFDLGMPSFRDIVDPLARRMLYDTVVNVILDLAGEAEILPPPQGADS